MKRFALATLAVLALGVVPVWADECPLNFPNLGGFVFPGDFDGATATCPGYTAALDAANTRIDKSQAVAAAMSAPAWLGDKENFSISGGVGFNESEAALGGTAIARLPGTPFSAYAGGAVDVDGDEWAGKAGLRAGF
jgi:hypothetical protein